MTDYVIDQLKQQCDALLAILDNDEVAARYASIAARYHTAFRQTGKFSHAEAFSLTMTIVGQINK